MRDDFVNLMSNEGVWFFSLFSLERQIRIVLGGLYF